MADSDLNWCSCGKTTQPQSLYCSTICKEREEHPATSLTSWSLDGLESDGAAPIAFYPHTHLQNVLASPHSPFINPNHLPPTAFTPLINPTASPRFSSSRHSVKSSPFALANTGSQHTSIPFLALPMSEIDLPPPAQADAVLSGQRSRKSSSNMMSPYSAPMSIPNNNSIPVLKSPYLGGNRALLPSPRLQGRVVPASPFMNGGGQDYSSTAGLEGGMVTVEGAHACVDDLHASLAFNNRKK